MSNEEMDALNCACAEVMGWTDVIPYPEGYSLGLPPGGDPEMTARSRIPTPCTSWSDFGALLTALAAKGHGPEVSFLTYDGKWMAALNEFTITVDGCADPRIALALAVKSLRDGAK